MSRKNRKNRSKELDVSIFNALYSERQNDFLGADVREVKELTPELQEAFGRDLEERRTYLHYLSSRQGLIETGVITPNPLPGSRGERILACFFGLEYLPEQEKQEVEAPVSFRSRYSAG